jgi:FtsZ-interacting cell division protein ZipA
MSNNPYERHAKAYLIIVIIIIVIGFIATLFSGCSSVNKHKTIEQSKSDSITTKINDIKVDKKEDKAVDNKTSSSTNSVVNVEFEPDTTNNDSTDNTAVVVKIDNGKFEIVPGKRKLKSITANIEQTKDSTTKENTSTAENTTDKTQQHTDVKKENKAVVVDKKSTRVKIFSFIALSGALIALFIYFKRKTNESITT